MPILLKDDMTEGEIVDALLQAFADQSNYEPFEKEVANGVFAEINPWIGRGARQYAEQAAALIKARRADPQGPCREKMKYYESRIKDLLEAADWYLNRARHAESKIRESIKCFDAAISEGLLDRLEAQKNKQTGGLYDLITRRVMCAYHYLTGEIKP